MSGSGISWAICKSAPRSRQITMPATHHSSALPAAQPTESKNWRQYILQLQKVPMDRIFGDKCIMIFCMMDALTITQWQPQCQSTQGNKLQLKNVRLKYKCKLYTQKVGHKLFHIVQCHCPSSDKLHGTLCCTEDCSPVFRQHCQMQCNRNSEATAGKQPPESEVRLFLISMLIQRRLPGSNVQLWCLPLRPPKYSHNH